MEMLSFFAGAGFALCTIVLIAIICCLFSARTLDQLDNGMAELHRDRVDATATTQRSVDRSA